LVRFALVALGAIALLSCNASKTNQANAAGNGIVASAETRTAAKPPLTHDQALALMKQRHQNMEALGDAMKKAGTTLQSSSPDIDAVKQAAAQIAGLAPKLLSWFPNGTGPDVGKTRAKVEIWQKPEDFALKAHDFVQAASDFNGAAQSGDIGQIHASFGGVGKACKACHDLYRAPEH
jgi:cytochrome c556